MGRLSAEMHKVTGTMKSMASAALALAGIGGMGAVARGFVNAAATAQEVDSKFRTVFRNISGEAEKWSQQFGREVGRSQNDLKEWMGLLQDTFVPLGLSREMAYGLSKSITRLAVDVASFNNKMDAEVIRDFTSALVGNHETVRKYGVMISQSSMEQEMMRQGIDKTYDSLTDLEKVQLRYNVLLSGTSDAQGDATRTADTYTNQMKRLHASWEDMSTTMGQELVPALTDVVKLLNEAIPMVLKLKGTFGVTGIRNARLEKVVEEIATAEANMAKYEKAIAEKGPDSVSTYWMPDALNRTSNKWSNLIAERNLLMDQLGIQKEIGLRNRNRAIVPESTTSIQELMRADMAGAGKASSILYDENYGPQMGTAKNVSAASSATDKLRSSTDGLIDSLNNQIRTYELVNAGRAKSIEIATFMLQAEKAYGEGTTETADAVERYGMALEKFNQIREDFQRKEQEAAEEIQRQQQEAADQAAARESVNQTLAGMRIELGMIGDISNSWDRSREYAQFHADAVKAAAGNLEEYNRYMAEAGALHKQAQMAERFAEVQQTIRSESLNALRSMSRDWDNWQDHAMTAIENVYWKMVEMSVLDPMASGLSKGLSAALSGIAPSIFGAAAAGGVSAQYGVTGGMIGPAPMANGGIMTQYGPMNLRKYASGGIAYAPQVAVYGEGSMNEAYVPLPDGRTIPVTMSGGSGGIQVQVYHVGDGRGPVTTEQTQVDNRQVISVFMQDSTHGGQTARQIKQLARRVN